jgi:hypothetical protein
MNGPIRCALPGMRRAAQQNPLAAPLAGVVGRNTRGEATRVETRAQVGPAPAGSAARGVGRRRGGRREVGGTRVARPGAARDGAGADPQTSRGPTAPPGTSARPAAICGA